MSIAETSLGEAKRNAILESARDVFLAYGFSRTTMDDIARAAKLSRPALYLHFKNKTAIYRGLAERMLRQSMHSADSQLQEDGPFEQRLYLAINSSLLDLIAEIMQAPHGSELLDVKNSLAADLVGEWHTSMATLFTTAIQNEADAAEIDLEDRGLSAIGLAETLLDGLEGMKTRLQTADELAIAARRIVKLVALALR